MSVRSASRPAGGQFRAQIDGEAIEDGLASGERAPEAARFAGADGAQFGIEVGDDVVQAFELAQRPGEAGGDRRQPVGTVGRVGIALYRDQRIEVALVEGVVDLEHDLLAPGSILVILGEVRVVAAGEFEVNALDLGGEGRAFLRLVDVAAVPGAAEGGVGSGPIVVFRFGRLWRRAGLAAQASDAAFAQADRPADVVQLGEDGCESDLGFGGEAVEIVRQVGELRLQFGDDAAARLDLEEGMSVGAVFGGKDTDKRRGTGQGRLSRTEIDAGRRAAVRWHTIDHTPGTGQNLPPAAKRFFDGFRNRPNMPSTGSRRGQSDIIAPIGRYPQEDLDARLEAMLEVTDERYTQQRVQSSNTRIVAGFSCDSSLTGGALPGIHRSGGARGLAGAGGDDWQGACLRNSGRGRLRDVAVLPGLR